jgi:hypothetical protein
MASQYPLYDDLGVGGDAVRTHVVFGDSTTLAPTADADGEAKVALAHSAGGG